MIEVIQSATFRKWLDRLPDRRARTMIVARIVRLSHGAFGDTSFIGDGINELGGKLMAEDFYPFEPARWLDDVDTIEVFLADAFDTGEVTHIAAALEVIAHAPGLGKLAEQQGLTRMAVENTLLASRAQPVDVMIRLLNSIGLNGPTEVSPQRLAD